MFGEWLNAIQMSYAGFMALYVLLLLMLGTIIDTASIILIVVPLFLPALEPFGITLIPVRNHHGGGCRDWPADAPFWHLLLCHQGHDILTRTSPLTMCSWGHCLLLRSCWAYWYCSSCSPRSASPCFDTPYQESPPMTNGSLAATHRPCRRQRRTGQTPVRDIHPAHRKLGRIACAFACTSGLPKGPGGTRHYVWRRPFCG